MPGCPRSAGPQTLLILFIHMRNAAAGDAGDDADDADAFDIGSFKSHGAIHRVLRDELDPAGTVIHIFDKSLIVDHDHRHRASVGNILDEHVDEIAVIDDRGHAITLDADADGVLGLVGVAEAHGDIFGGGVLCGGSQTVS